MCNDCGCGTTDALLKLFIAKRIADRVEELELFSAWDITQELRAEVGPSYNISHTVVREQVEDWFENDGKFGKNSGQEYTRTLINLKNGKVTYVYHPLTVVAEEYPDFASLAETMKPMHIDSSKSVTENLEKYKSLDDEVDDHSLADCKCELECLVDAVEQFLNGEETISDLEEQLDSAREYLDKIDNS